MPEFPRVVLCGDLSSKWLRLERVLLETDKLAVIRFSGSPTEILDQCRRLTPCALVLNDALLDRFDSEEFCRAVDFGQSIQALVEINAPDLARAEELLRLGCAGLLNRGASSAEARRALHAIFEGQLWASRRIVSNVMHKLLRELKHRLTARESEILVFLAEGLKNHEIADRLFISPQTVRWHLRSLYTKLGTHDRTRAAVSGAAPRG